MGKPHPGKARMSQMIAEELFKGKRKDAEGEEKSKLSEGKNYKQKMQ